MESLKTLFILSPKSRTGKVKTSLLFMSYLTYVKVIHLLAYHSMAYHLSRLLLTFRGRMLPATLHVQHLGQYDYHFSNFNGHS